MGRLRKSVVDRIVRLRNQRFTQAETAEKTGVHLKTVQKYDPLRKSKKVEVVPLAPGTPIEELKSDINTLGDWVEALRLSLEDKAKADLLCPKCLEGRVEDTGGVFVCRRCGYEMKAIGNVWKSGKEPGK